MPMHATASSQAEHSSGTLLQRLSGFAFLSPVIVSAILLGCLVWMRLPSIVFPHELNVDESQWLSQGMKFLQDPRPWKAVEHIQRAAELLSDINCSAHGLQTGI